MNQIDSLCLRRQAERSGRRLIVWLCVSLLLVGAAWGCERERTSPSPTTPIKIGVWGAFSGGASPVGMSMLEGVRLAVKDLNDGGGLLGRPIEIVFRDDEAKNERSAQVIQELIFQQKVDFLVGPVNTGSALASLPFAQLQRIPVIVPVATGTKITQIFANEPENYVFRVAAYDSLQADMIVETAVNGLGLRRPAIIADSSNYGQLGRADLEVALKKFNLQPAAVEKFNVGDIDMTAQVQRARQAGANVLLLYGIGPELAQVVNAAGRLGWVVPKIGSWNFAMSNFIANAGPNAEGAIAPEAFILEETRSDHQQLLNQYRKMFGQRFPTSPIALAQAIDATRLLAAAIRQAGTVEGPSVRSALENLQESVQGLVTTYVRPFSRTDHEALARENVQLGIVRQGGMVPWTR